jgi:hypothetical protein
MPKSIPFSSREKRARMREARVAIGRLLHAEYVPMLTEPLPSELKHLLAQLVAREGRGGDSSEHSLEALSSIIA